MTITPKNFRYSYIFLVISLILFSTSFLSYDNALIITILFLLLVNITCFSNEYLVIKYYQKNQQKNPNKGYALLVMIQVLFTLLIFGVFKFFF